MWGLNDPSSRSMDLDEGLFYLSEHSSGPVGPDESSQRALKYITNFSKDRRRNIF